MSKIEELIREKCPNGVRRVALAELVKYEQPGRYIVSSTNYDDTYLIPVLTAGQSFILGYTDEKEGVYHADKKSPVIIFDDFTAAFKWVDFDFKVKSSAMKILTANDGVSLRYVYHMMGSIGYTSNEHKRLWIGTYSALEIPVPPLNIQEEIVDVLDSFTELEAELEARRKQYEHYRDQLLSFENMSIGGGAS